MKRARTSKRLADALIEDIAHSIASGSYSPKHGDRAVLDEDAGGGSARAPDDLVSRAATWLKERRAWCCCARDAAHLAHLRNIGGRR